LSLRVVLSLSKYKLHWQHRFIATTFVRPICVLLYRTVPYTQKVLNHFRKTKQSDHIT